MRSSILVALALALLAPATARAESPPEPEPAIGVAVVGHVGLGTPHGLFGASLEGTYRRWVRLELGTGIPWHGGPQVTAMITGLLGRSGIGVGAGVSAGRYIWERSYWCEAFCDRREWDRAWWVNGQVSYRRHVGRSRWQWGPYAGFSQMLNGEEGRCTDGDCPDPDAGERLYYGGVVLGRSF